MQVLNLQELLVFILDPSGILTQVSTRGCQGLYTSSPKTFHLGLQRSMSRRRQSSLYLPQRRLKWPMWELKALQLWRPPSDLWKSTPSDGFKRCGLIAVGILVLQAQGLYNLAISICQHLPLSRLHQTGQLCGFNWNPEILAQTMISYISVYTPKSIQTQSMVSLTYELSAPCSFGNFHYTLQTMENQVDVEAETAKVEQELGAQEFNMQEIENQQRLQVSFTCPRIQHAGNWESAATSGIIHLSVVSSELLKHCTWP